ncbi:SHOCT domain-containing protein [Gammaproteobacteria bacterium]|nr:SHOCT domain-containing protein [Gammaproteobacteria bacterium]
MKKLLLPSLFLTSIIFPEYLLANSDESLQNQSATVVITRITKSGKPKNYLTSNAKVRLNNNPKMKFKMKPTMTFKVPVGINTIFVNENLTVGQSSVTFDAKANETYTFNVYYRQESYWATLYGGYLGQAMESSIAGETLGGTFGIRMTDTTYNPSLEISKESITQISESKQPVEVKEVKAKDIEEELIKLKSLYDKGLIDEEVYKEMQKELLSGK